MAVRSLVPMGGRRGVALASSAVQTSNRFRAVRTAAVTDRDGPHSSLVRLARRSKSLSVSKPSVAAAQVVQMVGYRHVHGGRGLRGEYDVRHVGRRPEFAGVLVIGRPAAGAGLNKSPHPGIFAGERGIGLEP